MSIDMVKLIPFKNFSYMKKQLYSEKCFFLKGSFKQKGSDKIISGDNFEAKKIVGLSIEQIYKLYIQWFNHTLRPGEKERSFVSATSEDFE